MPDQSVKPSKPETSFSSLSFGELVRRLTEAPADSRQDASTALAGLGKGIDPQRHPIDATGEAAPQEQALD